MPKTARSTAAALLAAALLALTGHAAVAAAGGTQHVASSVRTQGVPCTSCNGGF